jgi:hypothetical protein
MNFNLDFEPHGGLISQSTHHQKIVVSEGSHMIKWKGSLIVYKITQSGLISSSDKVLIGFNASISSRKTKIPPFFTGGDKAANIPNPILSISDPSTHGDNESHGWYIGTQNDPNYQQNLAEFIESFCTENLLSPILFGGASGGFASIAIGDLLKIESVVIAMNPHIDIRAWYASSVEKFYKNKWNCSSMSEFSEALDYHGITYDLSKLLHNPKSSVLILQNILDDYLMKNHILNIINCSLKDLKSTFEVSNITLFFGIWGDGHCSPWTRHIRHVLQMAIKSDSKPAMIEYFQGEFYPAVQTTNSVKKSDISLSGGGMIGDYSTMMAYKARTDLSYENIPTYGYSFSKYDRSDRNLAFCIHSLRQIDFFLKKPEISPFSNLIALHHVLSWWDFVNSEAGKDSEMAWYDMSSGLRAQKIAYLLDLADSIPVMKKYQQTLVEIAEIHIQWFDKPDFIKFGNHGIFQIHGYMALIKSLGKVELEKKVVSLMTKIFESQFSSNQMHIENSPEYHQFVLSIFDIYFRTNWYGKNITKKLSTAKIHNYWLSDTENRYFCIGDSEPKLINISEDLKRRAIDDSDFNFTLGSETYHVKAFDETGYLCLKSSQVKGNVFFSLSAFPSIGHRQADDLSFVLFDQGKWRFDDPGKYTYQRDKRKYINRSHQHNCLTIDGKSHPLSSKDMYSSCREQIVYHEELKTFQTSMRWMPQDGVEHHRHCYYSPNEFFVLIDHVNSEKKHDYSQWFQIGQSYEKFTQEESTILFDTEDLDFFQIDLFCTDLESGIRTYFGDHHKPVGWISKKYTTLIPNLAIEHSVCSKSAEIWAISTFKKGITQKEIIAKIRRIDLGK